MMVRETVECIHGVNGFLKTNKGERRKATFVWHRDADERKVILVRVDMMSNPTPAGMQRECVCGGVHPPWIMLPEVRGVR